VVESIPGSESTSSYARQISWVDRATWLPLRVEFYRAGSSEPVKVMEASDVRQIDGHWLTGIVTMTTTESGHRTLLEFRQVRYDVPLDPGFFTTTFLETGRPR
jgi:outer membrane lipoprotein-sorting protein